MTATPLFMMVQSGEDAEALCEAFEARLDALEIIIRSETDHLAAARLADAFALHERKALEAQTYERSLDEFRRNSVALARFKPSGLDRVKMRQGALQASLEANLKTLQTLKTVSESLLRGVAKDVAAARSPGLYGRGGKVDTATAGKAAPLLVSNRY
jgi:SpoVK/Ycf46/Vps4 family AAA+-type ATPase